MTFIKRDKKISQKSPIIRNVGSNFFTRGR